MQNLKKLLAVFCLLVFLFPFVESGIHNYAHANDFYCKAAVHHLHKAEHHCSLCDFTTDIAATPSFADYHFRVNTLKEIHFFTPQNYSPLRNRDFRSLRAPPVLV